MTPIVDSHLHVWRALPAEEPGVPTIVSPHEEVPTDRTLEVLEGHGVSHAVLVQPMFRGEDNGYVADAAAGRPDRVCAVCVVDPRTPGAADRLEHWVVERGCRGLRLRPKVPAEAAVFGSPATFPLWERARDLGVVISILADPEHLDTLDTLAARFPDVFVVIDHLAHPHVSEGKDSAGFQALLALARHPRVLVKISGYYHFTDQPDPYPACWDLVHAVYDQFGPERLLWGSDYPHVERRGGYARSLELVRRDFPFLNEADRAQILGSNALRLYWNGDAMT
jgi:predicted TIM-barrel fold metal-dependent hydrolase